MIGYEAVLLDLVIDAVVITLAAFFIFITYTAIRQKQSKWKSSVPALVAIFVAIGFILPQSAQMKMFLRVRNLHSADIKSVAANGRLIASSQEIGTLADNFRNVQWFVSQHDGWGQEVPLVIETQSGERITLKVACYLKKRGAVLRGRLGGRHAYQEYDVAFSEGLLDTLNGLGAALPEKR